MPCRTEQTRFLTKAGRTGHGRKDYRGQIEYFAVYCRDTGKVYLVPVDHVGTTNARLRLVETENRQSKNVRWARDYELLEVTAVGLEPTTTRVKENDTSFP